jgi:hypothetical protein
MVDMRSQVAGDFQCARIRIDNMAACVNDSYGERDAHRVKVAAGKPSDPDVKRIEAPAEK